jgi:hypothetical protein
VSEGSPTEHIVRARAVADAPVEQLLAHVEDLARRWVIAQFATRPLREMGDVPLAQLARDAPALCEQFVRALASDAELARLVSDDDGSTRERDPSDASASRALALGAGDASSVVAAVESLRSVLWHQALAELRDPPPALVADLADRLASVCASVLAATLTAHGRERDADAARPHDGSSARAPRARHAVPTAGRGGAVLIDELHGDSSRRESPPRSSASPDAAFEAGRSKGAPGARARPWDTPLRGEGSEPPFFSDAPAIAGRDVRDEDESSLRIRRASSVSVDELR